MKEVSGSQESYGTVTKTDSNFDVQWRKEYRAGKSETSAGNVWSRIEAFGEGAMGAYVAAGYTGTSSAAGAVDAAISDLWIMGLGTDGEVAWERIIDHGNLDRAFAIDSTSDQGYVVGGSSWRDATGSRDFYIVKLDKKGKTLWERTHDGRDGSADSVFDVHQTGDGGYILVGESEDYGGEEVMGLLKLTGNGEIDGVQD